MALKKSQLYSSIWQACDELRGGMDASQYKDYVLVLLFIRYVTDKYADKSDSLVDIPPGGSFSDLVALKGKTDIGEGINGVLDVLAEANGLSGVINSVDFDDEEKLGKGKEKQDRLSKLVAIFENPDLDFSKNKADGDDLLGDAYEYLMKHFAVESGKSKGQFYTPAEVSRIIAKVIGAKNAKNRTQTVYDPACGSGSLLLKVAAEAKPVDISIYGKEKENATAALAILNMWLHGEPTAVIKKGQSTLSNPLFTDNGALKTFDYVVANPPFSYKAWRNGFTPEEDSYGRFDGFGIPPNKNGDYAFLLHIVKSLKSTGKGACVLPHGVLFRGNTEAAIRTNLVKRGYIKAIIGLPANLFYGTGIPACIVFIDKEGASERKGIFMIDASKGFVKDGNKNRLREQDICKIIDVWSEQAELQKFSHFATNEEIEKNEYNLNLPRYIDTSEAEDIQDIQSHLKGGIPESDIDLLNNYWTVCPTLKASLFKNSPRPGYSDVAIPAEKIRPVILEYNEFLKFRKNVQATFDSWRKTQTPVLKGLGKDNNPKAVISKSSTDLLEAFKETRLIDKYDIYQHLMTYWEEIMQDDTYIVTADEWSAGNELIRLQKKNSKGTKKEIAGLASLEGRLIPVSLTTKTYLYQEKEKFDQLQSELEQIISCMEEIKQEHSGEEGLICEVTNEKGNITRGDLSKRIKEIKAMTNEGKQELELLENYKQLLEKESDIKAKIKEAEKDLEQKIIKKYPTFTIEEIKKLVVDLKWMTELENRIMGEVDRLAQTLAGRVKELAERYGETLPQIEKETETLTRKVEEHLKKMGFTW
ncbi:MAG: N-6 DNA methylase [Bacteroidetes bacterium]|nr:N-6 DNA methylase [Bacteroidota bacterium]